MGCQQQVMTAMHFKQTVSVNQLCKLKWSINSICSTFTASVSTTKLTNSMEISFYIFEIVFILYFHNGGLFELYACVCTLNQSTSFNLPVNKPSIQISWNLWRQDKQQKQNYRTTPRSLQLTLLFNLNFLLLNFFETNNNRQFVPFSFNYGKSLYVVYCLKHTLLLECFGEYVPYAKKTRYSNNTP